MNRMYYFPDSNSEAGQESFVLNMLDEKKDGYYLEIGAFESKHTSNTYLLEKEYGWKGVSFEIVPERANQFNGDRSNPCICADATTFDYKSYLDENNFPRRIDYLQLDVEPAENTLLALKQLPLNDYRFSVITYEHDLYVDPENNKHIKAESIELLKSYGYVLAVENIKVDHPDWPLREFEDWWIDPEVVTEDKYKNLMLRYM